MGKGKLAKFADMAANPLVVERPYRPGDEPPRLDWHSEFFHNDNPIILELGCGRGEYTVGMGRLYPHNNYIGVDIKGARMWTGAQEALREDLHNVGFLRTNIEFIDKFFSPCEVSEIWLTFSDPQMKKATKRLTSTYFLQRYRHIMPDGGIIHLKTDSNFLFTYTEEMLRANSILPIVSTRNLYGETSVETTRRCGAHVASTSSIWLSACHRRECSWNRMWRFLLTNTAVTGATRGAGTSVVLDDRAGCF